MADSEWLLTGVIIGVLIGIPLGYIILQIFKPREQASVVFERDKEGRVSGIHYVPIGGKS
jgi:hypothetical protein